MVKKAASRVVIFGRIWGSGCGQSPQERAGASNIDRPHQPSFVSALALINSRLWPVKALETTRAKLASALRILAKLAALPEKDKDSAPCLAEAYELRLEAYQQFRAIQELLESAKFESDQDFRRMLDSISSAAQRVLLYLLAIIQHDLRPDAVPEPPQEASSRFRTVLGNELERLADRVKGQDHRQDQDLQTALDELERSVGSQIGLITEPKSWNRSALDWSCIS